MQAHILDKIGTLGVYYGTCLPISIEIGSCLAGIDYIEQKQLARFMKHGV